MPKTALGAEKSVGWQHDDNFFEVIHRLQTDGFTIAALEQTPQAQKLPDFHPPDKLALVLGHEVEGLEPEILKACDMAVEIPMLGTKESFNVVQAAAMALYHCRFYDSPEKQ